MCSHRNEVAVCPFELFLFRDIAQADELRSIRDALLLDGFVLVEPEAYSVLLERAGEADRCGYPRLA